LLFLSWQLWINNAIVAGKQADAVKEFSNGLTASPSSSAKSTAKPFVKPTAPDYGTPPALGPVGQNAVIGNMYVPRLGPGSTRAVANGVRDENATINQGYYGRYEDSQWPGEPGNFAVAVHRNGWGTSFTPAHLIRPGDNFYLETSQGWYVYTVRNTEYVVPTQVDVVNPMPMSEDPPIEGQNIMTITTCSPINGNGERLIVYGILTSWQPLDAGIPKEITALVEEARS
jgi:sortase A